jgi:tRNA1(Val) A37 N6-methylase TrmN6
MSEESVTEALFLGGQLSLRQPKQGHRAGTDAVLLAAAAPQEMEGLALDVGSGVGGAGLALAKLRPRIDVGLIEKDAAAAALARDNINRNGFASRARVYEADVLDRAALRAAGLSEPARLVITNPPFLDPARARLSTHSGRRAAHAMPRAGRGPLAAWIASCMALLEDGGIFILIHKPEALPEIFEALIGQAAALTLLPVQPRADKPAIRILIRAKKASRAAFAIAPALVLHDERGFLPQAEAIHCGKALIVW